MNDSCTSTASRLPSFAFLPKSHQGGAPHNNEQDDEHVVVEVVTKHKHARTVVATSVATPMATRMTAPMSGVMTCGVAGVVTGSMAGVLAGVVARRRACVVIARIRRAGTGALGRGGEAVQHAKGNMWILGLGEKQFQAHYRWGGALTILGRVVCMSTYGHLPRIVAL